MAQGSAHGGLVDIACFFFAVSANELVLTVATVRKSANQSRSSGRLHRFGTRHDGLEQVANAIIDEFDLRPCT